MGWRMPHHIRSHDDHIGSIGGVLGPFGLIAAYRVIVAGRPICKRWLLRAMYAGPGLIAVIFIAQTPVMMSNSGLFEALVLLSMLPALGAAHMQHLDPGPRFDSQAV